MWAHVPLPYFQAETMRLELESKLEAVMAHGDIEDREKHHLFSKVKGLRSNKQFGIDAVRTQHLCLIQFHALETRSNKFQS
jgi:hypothetical protein